MSIPKIHLEPIARKIRTCCLAIAFTLVPLNLGYLVPRLDTLYLGFTVVTVTLLFGFCIAGVELATWAVLFLLYINLGGIATQVYYVPFIVAGSFILLLALPVADYLLLRQERLIFDTIFCLMLAFLAITLASSWFAKDTEIALKWIVEFTAEGLLLYFLVINVVRSFEVLMRVIWVLLLACSLLGSLTLYQEITLNYTEEFGGLAQRRAEGWTGVDKNLEQDEILRTRTKVGTSNRAGGPVGDPNRYAQNLLMVLPLGFFVFFQERASRKARIASAVATGVIFSAILLTYSRGAFVTLILILGVLTLLRYIRVHRIVLSLPLLLGLVLIVAPGYLVRIQTLGGVEDPMSIESDQVIGKRLTEMLAAWNVFLDHPILGVGPGQYLGFYSQEYMSNPDIAFRDIDKRRRAHDLYVELAAETGVFGISVFAAIVVLAMRRLLQARRRWVGSRPGLAHLATAFLISMTAYLGTAIFLHLAFQRYFWLMLALSSVSVRILTSENGNGREAGAMPVQLNVA